VTVKRPVNLVLTEFMRDEGKLMPFQGGRRLVSIA
jgi:hypothetical protein